jgi:hypothetical protein
MGRVAKSQVVIIRVDAETKGRIAQAARDRGLTITTFLVSAADRAARTLARSAEVGTDKSRRTTESGRRLAGGACPAFFRTICHEARRGGYRGYAAAGYELTRHLPELVAGDPPKEVRGKLAELAKLIRRGDAPEVLAWFQRELPRCMALIPKRRHGTFLKGVSRMVQEDRSVLIS